MIDKIPFSGLLNELREFSPIKFKTVKAAKVYMNCIRNGKFKLAQKIENKWAKQKQYDLVEAFKYSLMAFAHQQNTKSK